MEDDLNFEVDGGRPHFQGGWKTTSIFMEKCEMTLIFLKMGDNLNFMANCKTNSFFRQIGR
jgi:hypothetical protein